MCTSAFFLYEKSITKMLYIDELYYWYFFIYALVS